MFMYLSVAIGGAIGASMRYAILNIFKHETMPYGTVIVNVAGSFIIGMVTAIFLLAPIHGLSNNIKLFITTGILGGFTTFSTFSLDAMKLLQNGENGSALLYISVSVIGSLVSVFLGYTIMSKII